MRIRISRMPFAVTDYTLYVKAQRYKRIEMDDLRAVMDARRPASNAADHWETRNLPLFPALC